MKRYIILFPSLMSVYVLQAQCARVTAPKQVTVGREFQVEYVVYTQDVRKFQLGRLSSGLEKISGPIISSQSSCQSVDGHTSSSSSVSFAYVSIATKKGNVDVDPAHIFVSDQELTSTPVKILATIGSHSVTGGGYYDSRTDSCVAVAKIIVNDLSIKVGANKATVYKQEPVLPTCKVYTTKNLRQLIGKTPGLVGFHIQEADLPQQKILHKEHIDKRLYNYVTRSQYVMYLQMTGTLQVPPLTFHGIIQESDGFGPFETFGIDGDSTSFKGDIVVPGLAVKVLLLPNRPTDFSGGVGHFNLSARLNEEEVRADNPITIRVAVSGTGNLRLIKKPITQIPKSLGSFNIKTTDKTQLVIKSAEGNMVCDQAVIPHQEELVAIPPVKFHYYSLVQKKYVALQTEPMELKVSRGSGFSKDTLSVDLPNKDILPLRIGDSPLGKADNLFSGSVTCYIILLLLLGVEGALSLYYRDRFAHRVNMVLRRGRNANRVASSRLHAAELLILKNKNLGFYGEILKASRGYVSDKLDLPIESLLRNSIREQFSKINVPFKVTDNYIFAISGCKYEHYTPGDEKGNVKRTLNVVIKAISDMGEIVRKLKPSGKKTFSFFFPVICMPIFSLQSPAQTEADIDKSYQKRDYVRAVRGYKKLLEQGKSTALYHNLGNSYHRPGNTPHAALPYERAQHLTPSDEDVRFNLQLAQSKTIDNLTPEPEAFFITWHKALADYLSADMWAILSLVCLLISISALVVYLFVDIESLRKLSRVILPIFLPFFTTNTLFAIRRVYLLGSESHDTIMIPLAAIGKMPDQKSAEAFIPHKSSKVGITDNSTSQWTEIKLGDGHQGWVKAENIGAI